MKLKDIVDYIDSFAPFEGCASWDNSGLLVGDPNAEAEKAIVCLDVTEHETELAERENARLIISHHPVIFRPIKRIGSTDCIYSAISKGIGIISAHTNLDKAVGGVNDSLCEILGYPYEKIPSPTADGFLNVCEAENGILASDFAELLRNKLSGAVRCNFSEKPIHKIAVCSGAGSDFVKEAALLGCDAFLTGDASYHDFLDAAHYGISLFAAGHFETENIILPVLCDKLKKRFPEMEFIASDRVCPIITVN